jgi:superfamily II DNA or RNA helicase
MQLHSWYNNEKFRIGLIVIPTGGGKSGIAALAPYVLNTTRVLVITPSLQITNQLAAAFGY